MSNDVKQIVAAYILGCLDKKNLYQFVEYMNRGGKEVEGELGELQNIISLIPILLNFENPPDYLKENIAQKILERELITKEISQREKTKNEIKGEDKLKTASVQKLKSKPLQGNLEKKILESTGKSKPKRSFANILIFILIVSLVGLAGYLYYFNQKLTNKIARLNSKLLQMKQETNVANNFLKENLQLIDLFNADDVMIFNLVDQDTSVDAKGKLFISFSQGEAILSINISGRIFSDESLAVWAVLNRSTILLGEIVYDPLIKYYKLEKLPAIEKSNIKIISITIQKRRSSDKVDSRTLMISKPN